MHDETLDRTTNCTGRVSAVNWAGYVEYCIAEGARRGAGCARARAHAHALTRAMRARAASLRRGTAV